MIEKYYKEIEKTIGSLKFAVTILLLFTALMILGTFIESFCGADFANRFLYKKPLFIVVQIFIFLSIYFATTIRLPFKKRLTGFYITHLGLLIIGIGSLITYISGIDGQLYLAPRETTRSVNLTKDQLTIENLDTKEKIYYPMPYTAFTADLNIPFKNMLIKNYLPFAKEKIEWQEPISNFNYSSTEYFFKNAFAEQSLTFSLNPEVNDEFPNLVDLGPLKFIYFSNIVKNCFQKNLDKNRFFINMITNECLIDVKTDQENTIEIIPESLKAKPTVILFGEQMLFWDKYQSTWVEKNFTGNKSIILPWMNAEINLVNQQNNLIPKKIPYYIYPKQKKGQLTEGDLKGASLEILGKTYWITNETPLGLRIRGVPYIFKLQSEKIELPVEVTLTYFKMDKDPGTNAPASYESFVDIFNGKTKNKAHIYMNHPLKLEGFTFYQASYSENNDGSYSSTLAVNVDQGRPLKYFGSLLLIFGATLHFYIKSKKGKI